MSNDTPTSVPSRQTMLDKFFAPIDIASLVFFRIAFGCIMVWEVQRYFSKGWIASHFIDPTFHFKYAGFEWVHPLPGNGMYFVWGAMGVCGALIALGLLYRAATITFTTLFAYMFLIEQTRYLNHFYLVLLISTLMILIPAHRAFSIDARLRPALRSDTAPAWALWMLRLQIGVVYFFGGIHKTNPDWLRGEPMRTWLHKKSDLTPLIGDWLATEPGVRMFVYGGLALDLLIVPMLLWRRTRWFALAAAVSFHIFNSNFFSIGIFPWFMIAATLMFFPPDWPRRLYARLRREKKTAVEAPTIEKGLRYVALPIRRKILVAFLALYTLVQVTLPWRPYLYPGHMLWSEQGMWFSWNMMLSIKRADVIFELHDPHSGATWTRRPEEYLTNFQRAVSIRRPEMMLELAHHIAEEARMDGFPDIEIYAKSVASINGRAPQVYLDPDVNLAQIQAGFGAIDWLIPLKEPYPPKEAWKAIELTEDQFEY